MGELALSNIVNISVALAPAGIGPFNVNNLILFTGDTPAEAPAGGYAIYKSASEVATDYGSTSVTSKMANAIFSQAPNILAGNGALIVAPLLEDELLVAAIQRLQALVTFCGVIKNGTFATDELMDAAEYVQTQNMLLFAPSATAAHVTATTGIFWQIMNAKLSQTRCLLYLADDYEAAMIMAAAYAGRALSVDHSGSNTTQTMHLKDLVGIGFDSGMNQTLFNTAVIAGADVYASFQGVPKVHCSGANRFFDQVYNQMWFTTSLGVAGFNALAQSSNKEPQTEEGVSTLKTAYQSICEQAKTNLYCAPGSWTGDTFGVLDDFLRNIKDVGYYIYSLPIAKQLEVDRAARKSPLIQIAIKEAGALHSSNVLVNINA